MVIAAVQRLVDWSPLPAIYLRHRSQIMAPASFAMLDFAAKLETLDNVDWIALVYPNGAVGARGSDPARGIIDGAGPNLAGIAAVPRWLVSFPTPRDRIPSVGRLWRTDVGARLAVGCPLCLRPRLSQLVDSALRKAFTTPSTVPTRSVSSACEDPVEVKAIGCISR
jgi:hypothetical protein